MGYRQLQYVIKELTMSTETAGLYFSMLDAKEKVLQPNKGGKRGQERQTPEILM